MILPSNEEGNGLISKFSHPPIPSEFLPMVVKGLLVLFNASDIVASEISFPSDEVIYSFLIYFVSSLYKGMKVKGHPGRA